MKFERQIEKERKKAQKLYDKKQDTVVCSYCGKLLKKTKQIVFMILKKKN